ncbi:hypothetical protein [Planotetraspora sp. GP83]|uniref:hypothetical protein n=1 Tax=Planotetraspora sp. GP83 TaxID=3156264 RepID=UPI003518502B
MAADELMENPRLKERHFWNRERRAIPAREVRRFGATGRTLEIEAAGGENRIMLNRWRIARAKSCPALGFSPDVSLSVRARRALT